MGCHCRVVIPATGSLLSARHGSHQSDWVSLSSQIQLASNQGLWPPLLKIVSWTSSCSYFWIATSKGALGEVPVELLVKVFEIIDKQLQTPSPLSAIPADDQVLDAAVSHVR